MRVSSLPTRYPRTTLIALAVATLFFAFQAQKIRVDSAVETLLPEHDPERAFYEETKRLFGSEEATIVALFAPDVFRPEILARIDTMSKRLAEIEGVREVVSLTTAVGAETHEGMLTIGPLMRELPRDQAAADALRQRVLSDPIYASNLVSRDSAATAVVVAYKPLGDQELLHLGVEDRIAAVAEETRGELGTAITGIQTLKVNGARMMEQDLKRFVPVSLLLVVVILIWEFRTIRGVLLPLAAVVVGVVWTLGIMVLSGRSINMGTLILPPLLMAIGIAYAIHVLSRFYQELAPGRTREEVITATVDHIRIPTIFAWLTTVLADATLALSAIPAIRDFGVYAVIGNTAIFLLSLILIPAALSLLPMPRRTPREEQRETALTRSLESLGSFAVRHRRAVLLGGALLCILALIGTTRIQLETDYLEFFGPGTRVRQDNTLIAERLGGAQPIYVVVAADEPQAIRKAETLEAIADLQQHIAGLPGVDSSLSIVDPLLLVRHALNPDAPRAVPETQAEVDQLVQFLDPDQIAPVVVGDWSRANVVVRTRLSGSNDLSRLVEQIQDYGRERFPGQIQVRPTGSIVLLNRSADALAQGQISSLWQILLVLLALMSGLFLSFRTGFLTLVPNVIPIVVLFGTMGFLGIDLNISTSMIAVIAIGIAIDDTIHYFNEFNLQIRRTGDSERAIIAVVRSVGRPIVFTALALSGGFLVLCLSNFEPIQQFGYLASMTMAVGLISELLITPGLVTITTVITVWDLLYVKLGPQPQREIPLFRGLRALEARIVVLMGRLASAAPGELITRRGEMRPELYVLLSGRTEIRGEGDHVIRSMGRGDVIGEMGLVRQRARSADVIVAERVEYVVLDVRFVDRLQRRHPRIAAKVFLNLTRILSDRLEDTTDQLVEARGPVTA